MKGYIIVDIPVDDPIEIDEYGMCAKLHICPCIPSKKKELYFDTEAEIKPMLMQARTDEDDIEVDSYWQGWNDCIEELEK